MLVLVDYTMQYQEVIKTKILTGWVTSFKSCTLKKMYVMHPSQMIRDLICTSVYQVEDVNYEVSQT